MDYEIILTDINISQDLNQYTDLKQYRIIKNNKETIIGTGKCDNIIYILKEDVFLNCLQKIPIIDLKRNTELKYFDDKFSIYNDRFSLTSKVIKIKRLENDTVYTVFQELTERNIVIGQDYKSAFRIIQFSVQKGILEFHSLHKCSEEFLVWPY